MAKTDNLARLRARVAALERWAQEPDPVAATQAARQAFLGRFETEVDPDGTLEPTERERRAHLARRAFFARLALASAQARARRSGRDRASTDGGCVPDSTLAAAWEDRRARADRSTKL